MTRDLYRGLGRAGDYAIRGKHGHIYPDEAGYLFTAAPNGEDLGELAWNDIYGRMCPLANRWPPNGEKALIRQ